MKNEVKKISKWIKKYVKDAGSDGVVIGLSGGVDSSTIAALAVKALGKNKVIGVTLPCGSNKKDKEDAELLAEHLDIKVINIDLEKPFKALVKARKKSMRGYGKNDLTFPNVKARLRMTTLYSIASDLNYLVIGTGNKSEFELGYYTKYGDGGVDIEPLNNYYKTTVLQIALELGLSSKFVYRVPTAGLWEGQTDEEEIGCSYRDLDRYLEGYKDVLLSKDQIARIKYLQRRAKHKQVMPPACPR